MHPTMFIAALFRITKTWKQPKCPSTEGWIKKMWLKKKKTMLYTYVMEYSSAIKNEIMYICSNMDGPRDYYTK